MNGAGEIGVAGRGAEKSAFRKVRDRSNLSRFAFDRVFREGERVSGKKVTDLYCGAREVLENGARETSVTGSGTEKSAHKKSATWKPFGPQSRFSRKRTRLRKMLRAI